MSATTTTETELQTTSLADLLRRVEALEAEGSKQIKKKNKLTIIAWGGNLDQIWPTTILATTAAASGMESSVFFTFWGLFAIVKPGVRITGDNWMQKMMSVMNPGSAQKAKLSRYHFAGAGPAMFKKLAQDHQVATPDELIALASDLGVRLIPCQMTMDLLGLKRDSAVRCSATRQVLVVGVPVPRGMARLSDRDAGECLGPAARAVVRDAN
ncbi:MAG: hypothetical protein E6G63_09485 [Actinobacteria bacterium]|nr:MAG: hypothetical protein E6G63_09485 [Actinomycetota bacterium]